MLPQEEELLLAVLEFHAHEPALLLALPDDGPEPAGIRLDMGDILGVSSSSPPAGKRVEVEVTAKPSTKHHKEPDIGTDHGRGSGSDLEGMLSFRPPGFVESTPQC